MASNFRKLDMDRVRECFQEQFASNPERFKAQIGPQQVMVYTMVGGGMIGRLHAEQPAEAYVDGRVGKLPYSRREIEQAVRVLALMAEVAGYDPHGFGRDNKPKLPAMPNVHGSGVF